MDHPKETCTLRKAVSIGENQVRVCKNLQDGPIGIFPKKIRKKDRPGVRVTDKPGQGFGLVSVFFIYRIILTLIELKQFQLFQKGFMEETLIETLIKATGCPREKVLKQLRNWLLKAGKNPKNPSLEDLREALIPVLQELFIDVASGKNNYIKINKSGEKSS